MRRARCWVWVLWVVAISSRTLAAPPPNDNFANAQVIAGCPGTAVGSNIEASKEPGEPDHEGVTDRSIWYAWTSPYNGPVTFDTGGSSTADPVVGFFLPSLTVYTGSSVNNLSRVPSIHGPTYSGRPFNVTFVADAGTTYYLAADGYPVFPPPTTVQGTIVLNWVCNDQFASTQTLTGASGNAHGINADATVEADELADVCQKSVWYSWTAPSATPTTFNLTDLDGCLTIAIYRGDDLASLQPIASWHPYTQPGSGYRGAPISFQPESGRTYRIKVNSADQCAAPCIGSAFSLTWAPAAGPPNDFLNNAFPITGLEGSIEAPAIEHPFVTATYEGEPAISVVKPGGIDFVTHGHSVWYRWTAPSDVCMVFETLRRGSANTTLAVFTGSSAVTAELVAADAYSGIQSSSTGGSRLAFRAVAGTEYHVMLDGFEPFGGGDAGAVLAWTYAGAGPANDNFANAQIITGPVGSIAGSNVGANIECGERELLGSSTIGGYISATVWYTWVSPVTARVAFTTDGSSFDSGLAIYTGDQVDALLLVGSSDDSGDIPNSSGVGPAKVVFDAVAGTAYRVSVGGFNNASGPLMLNWAPVPANDDFANAQTISGVDGTVAGNNLGASRNPGDPPSPYGRSIWYVWKPESDEHVSFDTLGSDWFVAVEAYTGESLESLLPVSTNAQPSGGIVFDAQAHVQYRLLVNGFSIGRTALTWLPVPGNDNYGTPLLVSGLSGMVAGNSRGATIEQGEYYCCGASIFRSTWFAWQAAADGVVTLEAVGSPSLILAVFTGGSSLADTGFVASALPAGITSFTATAGQQYRIGVALTDPNSTQSEFELHWSLVAASPTPTETPSPTPTPTNTPSPTFSHTLTATATGTPTPSVTRTFTATPTRTATTSPTVMATPTDTPAPIPCIGDCNDDTQVTVDELLTMVNIALGSADVGTCRPGDANNDKQITIDEILRAVNNALNECGV